MNGDICRASLHLCANVWTWCGQRRKMSAIAPCNKTGRWMHDFTILSNHTHTTSDRDLIPYKDGWKCSHLCATRGSPTSTGTKHMPIDGLSGMIDFARVVRSDGLLADVS